MEDEKLWGKVSCSFFSVPCGDIHVGCKERGHPTTGARMPQNPSAGYIKDTKKCIVFCKICFLWSVYKVMAFFKAQKEKVIYIKDKTFGGYN